MSKGWKFTLYLILILATIAVVWLMFGNTNPNVETPSDIDNEEVLTGEIEESIPENVNDDTPSFEEDVMKDLEGFFGDNNGYEDVQGEYGFTNPENE